MQCRLRAMKICHQVCRCGYGKPPHAHDRDQQRIREEAHLRLIVVHIYICHYILYTVYCIEYP